MQVYKKFVILIYVNRMKHKKLTKLFLIMSVLSISVTSIPINVFAKEASSYISLTGDTYDNGHKKAQITIDDIESWCAEFDYPFHNIVDEIRDITTGSSKTTTGNLAEFPGTVSNWVGWGTWEYDDGTDHTLDMSQLSQTSSSNAPTSEEAVSVGGSITSGCTTPYSVTVETISSPWSIEQQNAQSLFKWYVGDNEDLMRVLTWAVQAEKILVDIEQVGADNFVHITFSDDCDTYIKGFIGSDYKSMCDYREFVYKVTNIIQIPSFASKKWQDAVKNSKLIHLKWDSTIYGGKGGYTTTINDENGVLRYYDYSNALGEGYDITSSGGLLTIKTQNIVNKSKVSTAVKATENVFLPSDGCFYNTSYWRWKLEGKEVKGGRDYTYLKALPSTTHDHDWDCEWKCTNGGSVTNCNGDINAGWTSNSCSCDLGEGEYCTTDHGGHYTYHSHTTDCYHRYYCSYCSSPGTGEPSDDCSVSWTCKKQHYEPIKKTKTGLHYIDWQDLTRYEDKGNGMEDPPESFVAAITDWC